jgi:hypothetical protein
LFAHSHGVAKDTLRCSHASSGQRLQLDHAHNHLSFAVMYMLVWGHMGGMDWWLTSLFHVVRPCKACASSTAARAIAVFVGWIRMLKNQGMEVQGQ